MVTEDYVNFDTAELLNEKGFSDVQVYTYYSRYGGSFDMSPRVVTNKVLYTYGYIAAPTQQMAMKWLREKYNIYINIQPDFPSEIGYKMCWCWSVSILHKNCINTKRHQCYIETYEEAVEAALKHSLEYLI